MKKHAHKEWEPIAAQTAKHTAVLQRLACEREVLAVLIQHCVKPFENIDPDDIITTYIEGTLERDLPLVGIPGSRILGMDTVVDAVLGPEGAVAYTRPFILRDPASDKRIYLDVHVCMLASDKPDFSAVSQISKHALRWRSANYKREFFEGEWNRRTEFHSVWIVPNPPQGERACCVHHKADTWVTDQDPSKLPTDIYACVVGLGKDAKTQDAELGRLAFLNVLFAADMSTEDKREVLRRQYGFELTETMDWILSDQYNPSKDGTVMLLRPEDEPVESEAIRVNLNTLGLGF